VSTLCVTTDRQWNHIEDLDDFFTRVYHYHQRSGFLCMVLQDVLQLMYVAFFLLLYLFICVFFVLLLVLVTVFLHFSNLHTYLLSVFTTWLILPFTEIYVLWCIFVLSSFLAALHYLVLLYKVLFN